MFTLCMGRSTGSFHGVILGFLFPMFPPCQQCAAFGGDFTEDDDDCRAFQREFGCHACDGKGCWRKNRTCRFFGRQRERHGDAGLGDTVPHMRETNIRVFADGIEQQSSSQRRAPGWWRLCREVRVTTENKDFVMGHASGDGMNCLIDTLRQQLHVICNVSSVRRDLQQLHKCGSSRIRPGAYLELQHHWRDVIKLLGTYRLNGGPISLNPENFRIVCVDMMFIGSGDVEGDGPISIYIARQNANHFVPLLRSRASVNSSGPSACDGESCDQGRAASGKDPAPPTSEDSNQEKAGGSKDSAPPACGPNRAKLPNVCPEKDTEADGIEEQEGGRDHTEEPEDAGDVEDHRSEDSAAVAAQDFEAAVSDASDENADASGDVSGQEDDSKGCTLPENDADAVKKGVAALSSLAALRCVSFTRATLKAETDKSQSTSEKSPSEASQEDRADDDSSDGTSSAYDSDASDVFHLACEPCGTWCTEQDKEMKVARLIAKQLRRHPMVPPHPSDAAANTDFVQVDGGLNLPPAHCAFRGCAWVGKSKDSIKEHVLVEHRQQLLAAEQEVWGDGLFYGAAWPLRKTAFTLNAHPNNLPLQRHFFGYYVQAIAEVERCSVLCGQDEEREEETEGSQQRAKTSQGIPIVGPSIDRRTFGHLREVYNSQSIRALICFQGYRRSVKHRASSVEPRTVMRTVCLLF